MVATGGVGGSGTRLISQIFQDLGYFMGSDLNDSEDTLLFTLLFKYTQILTTTDREFDQNLEIFIQIMNSEKPLSLAQFEYLHTLAANKRTLHAKEWLEERIRRISVGKPHDLWGWKEPNSHIVIERLFTRIDDLKFIYVYRHGLDMAYSDNQNQLKLWGGVFFNQQSIDITPHNSFKYWCIVHRRILKLQKDYPKRILMLDYDQLCREPNGVLSELLAFIEYEHEYDIEAIKALIKTPSSIGRYRQFSLENFSQKDLEFVKTLYT